MRRSGVIALGLVGLALALRLALALALPNDEPDDGRVYAQLAHNLVAHGVYSVEEEAPFDATFVRVPGYPIFLAVVYRAFGDGNNRAVRVADAVVDTLTCGLVAGLAAVWVPRRWSVQRRRRAATIALGLAAVCPFVAVYVTTILTETLATALGTFVLLAGSLAVRRHDADGGLLPAWLPSATWLWAAAGLAGGAMTMVRPESGLYVGAVGVLLLATSWPSGARPIAEGLRRWWRAVLGGGLALSLGFGAVVAPWTIRNAIVFGRFEPLNPRSLSMPGEFVAWGYAAWLRSWIDHPRYVGPMLFALDRDPISVDQVPARAFDSADERAKVAALFLKYSTPAADAEADDSGHVPPGGMTPDLDAAFGAIATARAARHPVRQYLVLPAKRAIMLWFDPHADYYPFAGFLFPWSALDADRDQQFWLPLFTGLTLCWTVAGWAGVARLWQSPDSRRWLLLVALVIVPRLVLLASLENPEPRYTMEFFPLLSALAGCALAWGTVRR
jgi:hypothetical protein